MDIEKCTKCARTLSWIGLFDSAFLAIFKGTMGVLLGSRALTASALYSLHDVISGAAVLIGLKVSTRPPDKKHPYGYGNAEYIVCVFTSIIILGATIFLLADCVRIIFLGEHTPPHWAALGAVIISIVANEIIYRYNICAHKQLNSPALLAHAKHHRADVIASLAVGAAIIAGFMGCSFLDPLVALFEAVHLLILSAEILHQGGSGLVGRAIHQGDLAMIRNVVSNNPIVENVKNIKTRQIGRRVWVDLHVSLPKEKTVAQVHDISGQIRRDIETKVKDVGSVNVY
ncbi:MAG: cation diffusion facilitator family transporter, partial [Planctomycetota bacterium]